MNLLGSEYQDTLERKIRESNSGVRLFMGGVGVQKTGEEITDALKNVDVSTKYVLKLLREIEEQCVEGTRVTVVKHQFEVRVGNGDRTRFWLDVCSSETTHKNSFPGLFLLCSKPDARVQDFLVRDGNIMSPNLHLRRSPREWEIEQLGLLLQIIERVRIND